MEEDIVGTSIEVSRAIMVITTSISIRVNPQQEGCFFGIALS
jgi:hypothetical protein